MMKMTDKRMITAPLRYTDYLVSKIAETEAAAAQLYGHTNPQATNAVADAAREAAQRSVRLDASPLDEQTVATVDARLAAGLPPVDESTTGEDAAEQTSQGSWARTLKLEDMPTQEIAAVEYANMLAVSSVSVDLAREVFVQPLSTLVRLHGMITNGLVAPEVAGRPRRTEQAVHDGAQGQVLYHTPAPEDVPGLLEEWSTWLTTKAARMPSLAVAGVTHHALLSWQPFEGANGRVARAAARIILQGRGVDPDGVLVFERALEADALGYHREVAATARRGDLVGWLERWCDAVHAAALDAGRKHQLPVPSPSEEVRQVVGELPSGSGLTLRQVMERSGVDREQAVQDLNRLQRMGVMELVLGTQGLRWCKAGAAESYR